MKTPKLTLIGAGPGDAELITLKGVKALQKADVILYDALVDPCLLEYCKPTAISKFVGKRKGRHSLSQEEINDLIVTLAFKHGHVVRLKGGDPFVFGRGYEEIQAARAFDIETEYIPGVSSAYSVPGLSEIPVTHRGTSESFWVITATTSSGELSDDVLSAAKTNATAVILMGVGQLSKIVNAYSEEGKSNLPVAIIQNGSRPDQKLVVGTIKTIEKETALAKVEAPAVIVVGETVGLHLAAPRELFSHETGI
jgi:uroporphyrin-III C-methyltransferase